MLTLTHIFLHNWRHFERCLINIADGIAPSQNSDADWSTILDALKLVLVADMQPIRATNSMLGQSVHYAVPKQTNDDIHGENHTPNYANAWHQQHAGKTTTYVALEFTHAECESQVTLGVCIETIDSVFPTYFFFIVAESLDPTLFIHEDGVLTGQELQWALRPRNDAHIYRQVGEYQAEMLAYLGGLNQRFCDLFERAASFQPPRDMHQFVMQWLLEPRPLEREALHRATEDYTYLDMATREAQEKVTALHAIVRRQTDIRHLRQRYAENTVLAALLRLAAAQQCMDEQNHRLDWLQQRVARTETELASMQAERQKAHDALLEAKLKLRQTSVGRRYDEIQQDIKQISSDADIVHARWITLLHDLTLEEATLRPLLTPQSHAPSIEQTDGIDISLTPSEREKLRSLLDNIAALSPYQPPTKAFVALLEGVIPSLDAALSRAREAYFHVREQIKDLRHYGKELNHNLEHLREKERRYPKDVERVCELLTHVLGERPPLLCEVLEIPDERWQNAVEAMLGAQRFAILVQPKHVDLAMQVINRARTKEHIYDVRVLNVAKTLQDKRRVPEHSLAHQVQTSFEALRSYVGTLLGDIIACETVNELRQHRCAITPEVVLCINWTIYMLSPASYQPWYIGERASTSQIRFIVQELREMSNSLTILTQQAEHIGAHVERLSHVRILSNLLQRFDAPLDERPLRTQIANYIAQQQSLDTAGVESLNTEIEHLSNTIAQMQEEERRLIADTAAWYTEMEQRANDIENTKRDLEECEHQAGDVRSKYPYVVTTAEELLAGYLPDPETHNRQAAYMRIIRKVEAAARGFEMRLMNEMHQLVRLATTYNTRYHFVARPDDPDDQRYAAEEQRLTSVELPRYYEQIEKAKQKALEGVRDYVLHAMRERFFTARQQLDHFKDMLARLDIQGERYTFSYHLNEELSTYYELITEAHVLGTEPVINSELYARSKDVFDSLYLVLTRPPDTDEEKQKQECVLDYRRYFTYELGMIRTDTAQPASRLSARVKQKLGSDTPVPFYLIIAAAFTQLYYTNKQKDQPTIRLVPFNEAFSKIDQERADAVLDVYEKLGLQVISAKLVRET